MWDTINPLLSPCVTGLPRRKERKKGIFFLTRWLKIYQIWWKSLKLIKSNNQKTQTASGINIFYTDTSEQK